MTPTPLAAHQHASPQARVPPPENERSAQLPEREGRVLREGRNLVSKF